MLKVADEDNAVRGTLQDPGITANDAELSYKNDGDYESDYQEAQGLLPAQSIVISKCKVEPQRGVQGTSNLLNT